MKYVCIVAVASVVGAHACHAQERRQSQGHRLRYLNVWRPAPEDKTVNHLFPLGFKYRHRAGNFDSSGYVVAENTGGEIRLEIRLGCGVDCEGGRR